MNELHSQFIDEARELIQQANDDLVAAEREGVSDDHIDRLFRAFHTLKGSAGVIGLPAMESALHAAEDVLAALQQGKMDATAPVFDRLLVCLDQVANWVDDFSIQSELPVESGLAAREIVHGLRVLLDGGSGQPGTTPMDDALPEWAAVLIASEGAATGTAPSSHRVAFSYEPRAECFFDGDDPLAVVRKAPGLLALTVEFTREPRNLAAFDPYSCSLRLRGVCATTRAELAAVFRLVPDQVRIIDIPEAAVPALSAGQTGDEYALARAILDEQAQLLRELTVQENFVGRASSAARSAVGAVRFCGREELVDAIERAGALALADATAAPLLTALNEAEAMLASASVSEKEHQAQSTQSDPGLRGRSLRIEEGRVDALIDLAGELLVATHGFAHLAGQAESANLDAQGLARSIRERKDALERLTTEIHAAVLQLRMMPVAQVFRSFPRAVRDLSQQLGKDVRLVVQGEMTEADKTIVDRLFEPLMHLIRNAIDHGIETSAERSAAGKPASATITLRALQAGDRLVVEVRDDGRGIDPALIRRQAREKALLPEAELAALTDDQVVSLVFAAGFSTAARVSAVSGRGVGMDAVRASIEQIGGRVSLKSGVGTGTHVSLDFPMNIALLRIMVVESGGQVLGIPMDAVRETVRLKPDQITRFKQNEGFVFHEKVVPICSLAELLQLPPKVGSGGDRLVVVSEVAGRTTALEVDAINERLEVVLKPMHRLLSSARSYAGTTLLGDGAVLLVLDLREILP
jgi:two-component system chemotaxis sensor kinase CheA